MSGKLPMDDFERALRSRIEKMIRDIVDEVPRLVELVTGPLKSVRRVVEGDFLVPESDIYVKDDVVFVVLQVPGAQKDLIDVRLRDNVLELEARFSEELVKRAPDASIFKFRGYKCNLNLPKWVDPNLAKAVYRDGVLVLELPVQKPKGIHVKIE